MLLDEEKIKKEIEKRIQDSDPNANSFTFELASEDILGNYVYYVEWASQGKESDETLSYVLVNKDGKISVFDDGIDILRDIQEKLERKRNIIQRITEFSLVELVGAIIAMLITFLFVYKGFTGEIEQELVGIFGIILGYYFGKTVEMKG